MQIHQNQLHKYNSYKERDLRPLRRISTKAHVEKSTESLSQSLCHDRSTSLIENISLRHELEMSDDIHKHLFCIIKSKEPIIAKKYMQQPQYSPLQKRQSNVDFTSCCIKRMQAHKYKMRQQYTSFNQKAKQQFSDHSLKLDLTPFNKKNSEEAKTKFNHSGKQILFERSNNSFIFLKNGEKTFQYPSISPEKKGKKQIIGKLEEHLQKFHNFMLDLLPREHSSFTDIQYLGYDSNPYFTQKRFYSARLDYNIESKNYHRNGNEQQKQLYEEEKGKHKSVEGKIHSLIDLLAYDDIGMRLFYEIGTVNLNQLNTKYKKINISFSESDLLCMMKQMVSNTVEFIQNKWFYNNYQDTKNLVFVKSGGCQGYKIKYLNLVYASDNQDQYNFENIVFKNSTYSSDSLSSFYPTNSQGLAAHMQNSSNNLNSGIKLNSIEESIESQQTNPSKINNNLDIDQEQVSLSNTINYQNSSSHGLPVDDQSSSSFLKNNKKKPKGINPAQRKLKKQGNKSDSNLEFQMSDSIMDQQSSYQSEKVWQKIQIYEIMQICSLIYSMFLEQNFANVDIRIREKSDVDFLSDYPRLQSYLMAFIKNTENFDLFQQQIIQLKKDKTIPSTLQIEDTLIEQIRQDQLLQLNKQISASTQGNSISSTDKTNNSKRQDDVQNTVGKDELKSMSMIAVQTINKLLQNELQILQSQDKSKPLPSETQDFYENLLDINQVQILDKSSLQIVTLIIDELLNRINEIQNPFYYADQVYSKALCHFKTNGDPQNCMSLLKYSISIIQRVQGNEVNENCGKAYCLMSQVILKQSNNRQRALEYAFNSYEIRKQVYGQQSRTVELAESLKQISYIYQQKGVYDEAYKYLEKACHILEEVRPHFHKSVIQILTDSALLAFNMQNYAGCLKKCQKILEIYKQCQFNIVNYNFPLLMNLTSLVRLRYAQADVQSRTLDNSMIKDIFKQSIKASKLMIQYSGDLKHTTPFTTYNHLKQLFQSFLKSIESEEYLISLQKTPEHKFKNSSATKKIDIQSYSLNPVLHAGKQLQPKAHQIHQNSRGVVYTFDYSRNAVDTSLNV